MALLWITRAGAVLFAALGVWLMLQPQMVAVFYPVTLDGPMAVSEMRAIFGGMMLGSGAAVLALDFWRRDPQSAALVLALVTLGLLLARVVGLAVEGIPSGPVRNEAIFEVLLFSALVATGALRRAP